MYPIYSIEALRRYREQHPVSDAAECAAVTDDDAVVVPDDDDRDEFDDLFDAWVDHNMEVSG
jgi:hypothetical protein